MKLESAAGWRGSTPPAFEAAAATAAETCPVSQALAGVSISAYRDARALTTAGGLRIVFLTFAFQHPQMRGSARQYHFIRELARATRSRCSR